jgi:hypothetical protein
MRGTQRLKVTGKLAPRYVSPCKIISRKGEVAYQLELPPYLSDIHDVFHVSQLKKCLRVLVEQLPMEDEATWEHEEELREDYPELFLSASESRGRDSF